MKAFFSIEMEQHMWDENSCHILADSSGMDEQYGTSQGKI